MPTVVVITTRCGDCGRHSSPPGEGAEGPPCRDPPEPRGARGSFSRVASQHVGRSADSTRVRGVGRGAGAPDGHFGVPRVVRRRGSRGVHRERRCRWRGAEGMIEAVALDKARIVREAAEDWQEASASWQWLVDSEDFLWVDPAGLAIDWLGTRMEDALQWEEAVLRRQTKQYLTKWAYDQKKRIGVEAAERAGQPSTEWSGMLDEFVVADRMT